MSNLHHQNIVEKYDFQENKRSYLIIMELCKLDLHKLWTKYFNKKIPEEYVLFILAQIINAFAYLHS